MHVGGKGPNKVFLAHCIREMYHEQWKIILDKEFMLAYKHGIVIKCLDGVLQQFYPRILTYSADYSEKVLLSSIRNWGSRPCPRCTIPKADLKNMGGIRDMSARLRCARVDDVSCRSRVERARQYIYEEDFGVNSKPVEDLLKDLSFVPVSNAFSARLGPLGFNFFQILVVDILHDWEIGAWKAVFVHLIHILHASDVALINELDARFRKVPTFGQDTIRKFSANTSEMKKLAARNYEDILQCAMPAFDGLLPEPHNSKILDLLYICATWHSLAKLRMHNDLTLAELDKTTKELGSCLRNFVTSSASGLSTRRAKALNLDTYKFHALGDVAGHIREFGTTDSYSTEIGELEHRAVKAWYSRTDRKAFTRQVARIKRCQARIERISRRTSDFATSFGDDLTVKQANGPEEHHFIGKTENLPVHIGQHINQHLGDPAVQDFIPRLKKHLLPRICAILAKEETPDEAAPRFSNGTFSLGLKTNGSSGQRRTILTSALAREDEDWQFYYVMQFCNQDMFMRYCWGLGVGHIQVRGAHSTTGASDGLDFPEPVAVGANGDDSGPQCSRDGTVPILTLIELEPHNSDSDSDDSVLVDGDGSDDESDGDDW
ncbi:hypothetical protein DXG01_014473 [Tephrocybe rancida]|nr:hypothetical protein DXG01_014473 [Tephrocybe rancida]